MVSIVIPLFNEEQSLPTLYKELLFALRLYKLHEIIFVDDGSTDESLEVLKKIKKNDTSVRIFSFRKNHGKAEALSFGFQKARGEYLVTFDADLQDDPAEIKGLIEQAQKGWDLVCGWRNSRNDPFLTVLSSKFFNFLARFFWGLSLHDYNCGLKVYKKHAVASIILYGGMHRFVPLLVHEQGFKVTEQEVRHRPRKYGRSKYGLSKIIRDLPDMFTMLFLTRYAKRPLHFFGVIGLSLFLVGALILGYLVIIKLTGEGIGNRPILFLGMLLVLTGLQIFFTGFLADLFISLSQRTRSEVGEIPLQYSTDTALKES